MSEIIFHKKIKLPDGGSVDYFTQMQTIIKNGNRITLPINMRIRVDKNGDWLSKVSNNGRWDEYDDKGRQIKRKT